VTANQRTHVQRSPKMFAA